MEAALSVYDKPKFKIMGDRALLAEVGDDIAEDVNEGVQTLCHGLSIQKLSGVVDLVPAYRSLMVTFDPLAIGRDELRERVGAVWERREQIELPKCRRHDIPVIYGGERGPDIQWVADYHRLTTDAVVELHSSCDYRVYMIGFTPGYPYMGLLPTELDTPRRDTPRTSVPKGSVGIAQRQTGIYPVTSPGGWQIIGWTDVNLFNPANDRPARLQMGDRVRFVPAGSGDLS